MKKTILFKVLILILLLLPVCVLSGCDLSDMIDDVSGIDDETGDESLEINEEDAVSNLQNLGNKSGYEIVYEFQDGESVGKSLMGRKGDVIWCLTADNVDGEYNDGFALVKDGESYHSYSYNQDEGFIFQGTYSEEYAESLETVYTIGYNYWLYFGYTYDGMYKKDGTSTICGRKCDKYVYDMSVLLASYKIKYVVYADQELGITLKLDMEVSSGSEQARLYYEVKSFNTGSKVNAPSLPEPIVDGE